MRMTDIDKATNNLLNWTTTDEWGPRFLGHHAEHLESAVDLFDADEHELLERLGDAATSLMAFVAEDFFTARFGEWGELNIIDDYLKQRGLMESESGRQYLEALRDSIPSLYEVVDIDRGKSLTVRDLLVPGEEVCVREHLASQSASLWDRIAARIVLLDGGSIFTGAVLLFRYDSANHVLQAFDKLLKEATRARRKAGKHRRRRGRVPVARREELIRQLPCAQIFTHFWLTESLYQAMAPLPELRNSDDEVLLFCEVSFPIVGDEAKVSALLDGIEGFERETEGVAAWRWCAPGSPVRRPARSRGRGSANAPQDATATTSLGRAEIGAGRLKLSVNSAERAERGHELLSSRLGDLVGSALRSSQEPYQALQAYRAQRKQEEPRRPTEEEVEAMRMYLDDHYRRTLDEPLPMLDGKTLRQAAATKAGRQEAIDWLKQLENMEHRRAAAGGHVAYETGWIWQELGIEGLR